MREIQISVPLPDALYESLRGLKRGLRGATTAPDLSGDRDIEWSWVASRIPLGSGEALDFGCGQSPLGLVAAHSGFRVTAVDLGDVTWFYRHDRLTFLQGDILNLPLEEGRFDLVINCSAIEHVGLPGRYGVAEALPEGDLRAMARMRALMKSGARMLLTIPVGRDSVFAPWHRVYGAERLPRLLDGFSTESREYWVKDAENRWRATDEAAALGAIPRQRHYGLGCFVLAKP